MEIYNKIQFFHTSYMGDCTNTEKITVKAVNAEVFVDGYKFGFGEGANRAYCNAKCEIRKSIDGRLCAFFYFERSPKFRDFVCGSTLQELLIKIFDIVFIP